MSGRTYHTTWKPAEDERLRQLYLVDRLPIVEIAYALARTLRATMWRIHILGLRRDRPGERPWTPSDLTTLKGLLAKRHSTTEIAAIMGRSVHAVGAKRHAVLRAAGEASAQQETLRTAQALAERDHRLSLPPRSLTAAMMGDPEPGRSALDQRGGHA